MHESVNQNEDKHSAAVDIKGLELFESTTIDDIVTPDADSIEWLTSTEAASRLHRSERTIQRYAKKKKLLSRTDNIGRLLIGLPTSDATITTIGDNRAGAGDTDSSVATNGDNDRLWQLLQEKDAKIEALVMRTGYLQAQLESSVQTIKLLEDRRSESWWRRIWKAITSG